MIAAIGFPFGALPAELKQAEAEWAASQGAEELDVVPDFRALANGSITSFADELGALCGLGLPLRVILDMARLTEDQLALAVEAAIDAGAARTTVWLYLLPTAAALAVTLMRGKPPEAISVARRTSTESSGPVRVRS